MFQHLINFCKHSAQNHHKKIYKEFTHLPEMYNVLTMKQKKRIRYLNNHFNYAKIQVIGSGAPGVPAFITLITDQLNYLFNCGEGTQRLCQEYRCRISKMDHIFLTNLTWKNVGGLAGLILTAQDNGQSEINIHAPEGIEDFIDIVKSFISVNSMKISFTSINTSEPFKDNVLTVWNIPLMKSFKNTEENISENEYELNTNDKRATTSVDSTQNYTNVGKKMKSTPKIVCYICEIRPKLGKLLLDKCTAYKIGPGPGRKLLKEGFSITTSDGTIIESKDVCEPCGPKTTFIVVDCPTKEYIDSLVNNPAFSKYKDPIPVAENNEVCGIFHFTPDEVFNDERYQNWLQKFAYNTEHVIFNEENNCMGSESIYKNQYLLHRLHPKIFPLLSKDGLKEDKETPHEYISRARALQSLNIRPIAQHLITSNIHKEEEEYLQELYKIHGIVEKLEELDTLVSKKSVQINESNLPNYPKIIMLGTGCSIPNKIRNTSSILLRIDNNTSILLDCGEGTLNQIFRFFGFVEGDNVLRTIRAIYVSHMHADHHLGLVGILSRRKTLTDTSLYLLVPPPMADWLNFYNSRFESISDQYNIIYNYDLYLNSTRISPPTLKLFYDQLKVKNVSTVFVNHCKHSYGISITLKDCSKIVYSGDTRFCQNLIKLGKNCNLLIHEATMDDGREDLAKRKFHSTSSEAISAGKFMNAKFILLTHFSQRYSKIPAIPEGESSVGLAYDFMEFKLQQLTLLPLFFPTMKVMFEEYNKVNS